jgi:hypothetical protein
MDAGNNSGQTIVSTLVSSSGSGFPSSSPEGSTKMNLFLLTLPTPAQFSLVVVPDDDNSTCNTPEATGQTEYHKQPKSGPLKA